MLKKKILFSSLFVLLATCHVKAQEQPVPIALQYQLFLKVLSFDRNLEKNVSDSLKIGVLFQELNQSSANAKDELISAFHQSKINSIKKIPVAILPINLTQENAASIFEQKTLDVILLTPLRAVDLHTISEQAIQNQIVLLSGVIEYVDETVAISLDLEGNRPIIVINQKNAKAMGMDLSSQILKLAKVIE